MTRTKIRKDSPYSTHNPRFPMGRLQFHLPYTFWHPANSLVTSTWPILDLIHGRRHLFFPSANPRPGASFRAGGFDGSSSSSPSSPRPGWANGHLYQKDHLWQGTERELFQASPKPRKIAYTLMIYIYIYYTRSHTGVVFGSQVSGVAGHPQPPWIAPLLMV